MSDEDASNNPADQLTALVQSSRAGDRAAFEEVVRLTGRSLFARLYLETGDPHRAEDLAQETFLLAWKRLRDLQDATKFPGWLASIAHRVVIDAARYDARKKRWAAIWTGAAPAPARAVETIKDRAATPSESAERDDERRRVLAALRSLPSEYREVLALRYLAGADVESIAQQTGVTVGSVRGLLQRGIKLLREAMEAGRWGSRG